MASKTASTGITIVSKVDAQGYVFHLVQGWQENGKWQRKRFKDRKKAETFAAELRVQLENQGRAQRMVLSPLSDDQHEEALAAFDRLGSTYTLTDAVTFFLRHHRPPEFTIRLGDAITLYIDDKEHDGLRPRSLKAIASVLSQFLTAADNPWVHESTAGQVEAFLRGLRARNGTDRATKKTWNNYRNELNAFFSWCVIPDKPSNRPFSFENPVSGIRVFAARQVREQQGDTPITTNPEKVLRLFSVLSRWRQGVMIPPFAMLYFSGIRPEELKRMASRRSALVNLKTSTITVPANVSKTRHDRQVSIAPNLAEWLEAFPGSLLPKNYDRLAKMVRKHFELTHDEPRHSFISYHVALHRSIGDAALQAGNSESIVKRHYLNVHPREDGEKFFRIGHDRVRRRAMFRQSRGQTEASLRVI
ncbi:hypothetical protein OJ996_20000 [Luteolibacter sp. GHJ8]|uniref:Core-binding (CB) domain-containing protein n=1 Tax=Luteolibacter rhizosphaerae TaxID=2989719 RepID=A0ABT3G7Q1_9BACT|nr:hypothetical protein [Luteolibacter rhizosphaerae]